MGLDRPPLMRRLREEVSIELRSRLNGCRT